MSHSRLVLDLIATDKTVVERADGWSVQCIHCGSRSLVDTQGRTALTIEHIVPKVHGGD